MPRSGRGRSPGITRTTRDPERTPARRLTEGPSLKGSTACLRRARSGSGPTGSELLVLQDTAGNAAVSRLLRSRHGGSPPPALQAKLMVGAANDPLEREADRVADQVMRSWASTPLTVGRDLPEDARLRRRAHPGHDPRSAFEAGGAVARRLSARRGQGQALPAQVRARMETGFGADFSAVRIHRDTEAADLSRGLHAQAFTHGNDVYFGAGAYDPASRSGQRLLAHELTHTLQQGATSLQCCAIGRPGTGGPVVQRHSSDEHFFLGNMTPAQIRSVADGNVTSLAKKSPLMKTVAKLGDPRGWGAQGGLQGLTGELRDALDVIDVHLTALNRWRTTGGPNPATITQGDTAFDHAWGGQLMVINCNNGPVAATVGDMNALPDFFGSFQDAQEVDSEVLQRTLQVIRREAWVGLNAMKARMLGTSYSYDEKTEGFAGLAGNKIGLRGKGPTAALGDLGETEKLTKGKTGEQGMPVARGATATLGRNACHFPPESWLRWKEMHQQAKDMIRGANSSAALPAVANEAIAMNAFADHYLQDSYASGHLINKSFVMAVAYEHATKATRSWRGMSANKIGALQTATAHQDAYQGPSDAKKVLDDNSSPSAKKRRGARRANDRFQNLEASDPQSALDRARGTAGNANAKQDAEVRAAGLDPNVISYDEYRTFLNDLWLQKITNTLHDKFCIAGLRVGSPDNPNIGRIYGDNNMLKSGEGAEYTARTSEMSREAINNLVQNRREELIEAEGGAQAGPPRPVHWTHAIFARFPDRVTTDSGQQMSLKDWATGQSMRKLIRDLVGVTHTEHYKQGKLTALLRPVSSGKKVAGGLSASHTPF